VERAVCPCRFTHSPEDTIAKAYDRTIDRAIGGHRNWSRVVSAVILVLGILAMIGLSQLRRGDQVARAARDIRVGNDSARVLAALGAPAIRCPAGDLAHLRNALPPGTPRITADEIMGGLREHTASRWVWGKRAGCLPRSGDTEVGFTRGGVVYWAVAEHGAGPATLP
jgi:hypothetical protein